MPRATTDSRITSDAPGALASGNCSAKFFAAKVAFEIPEKYQVEGAFTSEIPDELVSGLMDLFDDCEFDSANICSPPLLIVNVQETPTPKWIFDAEKRINAVLQNDQAQRPGTRDAEQT